MDTYILRSLIKHQETNGCDTSPLYVIHNGCLIETMVYCVGEALDTMFAVGHYKVILPRDMDLPYATIFEFSHAFFTNEEEAMDHLIISKLKQP